MSSLRNFSEVFLSRSTTQGRGGGGVQPASETEAYRQPRVLFRGHGPQDNYWEPFTNKEKRRKATVARAMGSI